MFWRLLHYYPTNILIHQTYRNQNQNWVVIIQTSVTPIKIPWDCHGAWNSAETQNTTDLGWWWDQDVAMHTEKKFPYNPFQTEFWIPSGSGYVDVHIWIEHQYVLNQWSLITFDNVFPFIFSCNKVVAISISSRPGSGCSSCVEKSVLFKVEHTCCRCCFMQPFQHVSSKEEMYFLYPFVRVFMPSNNDK